MIVYEISEDYLDCEGKCMPVFTNIDRCAQENTLIFGFYGGQYFDYFTKDIGLIRRDSASIDDSSQ